MKGIEVSGKPSQQISQLHGIADDEDVWQHGGTRIIVVGDVGDDDEYTLIGSVATYRQELQDLIDAQ